MGCAAAFLSDEGCGSPLDWEEDLSIESSASVVQWKLFLSPQEAKKKFVDDGTLPSGCELQPEYLDLRALLDDPIAQGALGKFARRIKVLDPFMCWIDIQEYKSIPDVTLSYRKSMALHIYNKYIRENSPLQMIKKLLEPMEVSAFEQLFSMDSESLFKQEIFDRVQYKCFLSIYQKLYLPFKETEEFHALTTALRRKYNRVKLNHFEYFGMLGEGGFGFVVHCRKKSTGKHYAMKIQTKKSLLHTFRENPWKANTEKKVFASCQHPFIINLEYAFQTESLAIMVLELAIGGDLNQSLLRSPMKRLAEERVRFYAGEIVIALSYLHQLGLVYRDLKPQNVLLGEDGHIRLVDLGGVMDENSLSTNAFRRANEQKQQQLGRLPLLMLHSTYEAGDSDSEDEDTKEAAKFPEGGSVAVDGGREHSAETDGMGDSPRTGILTAPSGKSFGALIPPTMMAPTLDLRQDSSNDNCSILKDKSIGEYRVEVPGVPSEHPKSEKNSSLKQHSDSRTPSSAKLIKEKFAAAFRSTSASPKQVRQSASQAKESPPQHLHSASPFHADAAVKGVAAAETSKKKFSVMGTMGYMAPEMVLLLLPKKNPDLPLGELTLTKRKSGYSHAVDWWALGVSIYKLLTGVRPFNTKEPPTDIVEMSEEMRLLLQENIHFLDYAKLFQKLTFPDEIEVSTEAMDLITQLLDVDVRTRLGSGKHGVRNIKKHPFFASIDWDLLEQKQVEPPFKSAPIDLDGSSFPYPDLTTLLSVHGRGYWMEDSPPDEHQMYFEQWDFASARTIRIEAGMAQTMMQYDNNFKVRQLMGSPMNVANTSTKKSSATAEAVRSPERLVPPSAGNVASKKRFGKLGGK